MPKGLQVVTFCNLCMNRTNDLPSRYSKGGYAVRALATFVVLLVIWQSLSSFGNLPVFILPSPRDIVSAFGRMIFEGQFWTNTLTSIGRIALGFLLSVTVSLPLGILLGTKRSIEAYVDPFISFIRYIPPSAFVPLSILWFGIGEGQKVFVVFISIAPYLLLLVAEAVIHVRKEYVEAAYTLGASKSDTYWKVIIPASLPAIWEAMRLMVGAAWTFIVIVEIVAAQSGLGYSIIQAQRFLQTANVITIIIVIGLLGLVTDILFRVASRIWFPWVERIR